MLAQAKLDTIKVLLVEDSPGDARFIEKHLLRANSFRSDVEHVERLQGALDRLAQESFDAVLLDLHLPDSQGMDSLRTIASRAHDTAVVVLTGLDDQDMGRQAVKEGAQDYLVKGEVTGEYLSRTLQYAIGRHRYQQQAAEAQLRARSAEIRAQEAERGRQELEREIAERKRAEAEVQSLNKLLEKRVMRLAALHSIDQVINASMDLELTLQVLLKQVVEQLGVAAAAILLYREETLTLEHGMSEGFCGTSIRESRLKLDEGVAGRVAFERRPVTITNLRDEKVSFRRQQLVREEGFCSYRAVPLIAKGRLLGVLEVYLRQATDFDQEWLGFADALAAQAAIAVDNAGLLRHLQRSNLELRLAYEATIEGWARALDLRDHETEGHSRRVTEMTLRLAQAMDVSEHELVHLRRGALLHDIGKMAVPDSILRKPDSLDEDEWAIMRQHPHYGYEFLAPISFLQPALDIPYCHHEKWDGSGYPRGLCGEQIPLAARIFAVVDVFDALTSARPYREAWPCERALALIKDEAGKHFDPRVAAKFVELMADG